MFTGDRSGDVLFAALHAVGLANQPTAVHRDDGLTLHGTRITAPVHCAPPDNKPTPAERDTCGRLAARRAGPARPRCGRWWCSARSAGSRCCRCWPGPAGRCRARARGSGTARTSRWPGSAAPLHLFGCYHVSQQNTFTGRLTPAMLEEVLRRGRRRGRARTARAEARRPERVRLVG